MQDSVSEQTGQSLLSFTDSKILQEHKISNDSSCILVPSSNISANQKQTCTTIAKRDFPETFVDFVADFKVYMAGKDAKKLQWINANLNILFRIGKEVSGAGGLIELLSKDELCSCVDTINGEVSMYSSDLLTEQFVLQVYCKYILEYEYLLAGHKLQLEHKDGILKRGFFNHALGETLKEKKKDLSFFQQDIWVFRKGYEQIDKNWQLITLENVCKYYQSQIVDIRIQKPMDYGFNPRRLTNLPYQMKLGQYRLYQKLCVQHGLDSTAEQSKSFFNKIANQYPTLLPHQKMLENDRIFFAVNFDPHQDKKFVNQIRHQLSGTFLNFQQDFDLLSYLQNDVPGCSSPQFYFKVKGCWTGGHQENICMCAVNINHGPDESEWFAIDLENVQKVRAALKAKFKMDLYQNEGLWYEKIDWFLENGFPIKRILQRKGDIVLTGPGTLHWVRSFGTAIQSAWNIFPKTDLQIKSALHRHIQNAKINFSKSGTIAFKSILLKYLNHESKTMSMDSLQLILDALNAWKSKQDSDTKKLVLRLGNLVSKPRSQHLSDIQSICLACFQQVFNFYVVNRRMHGIYCVKCAGFLKGKHLELFYKLEPFYVDCLLMQCGNWSMVFQEEIPQLCIGRHIGKTSCKKKEKKRVFNKKQMRDLIDMIKSPHIKTFEKIFSVVETSFDEKQETMSGKGSERAVSEQKTNVVNLRRTRSESVEGQIQPTKRLHATDPAKYVSSKKDHLQQGEQGQLSLSSSKASNEKASSRLAVKTNQKDVVYRQEYNKNHEQRERYIYVPREHGWRGRNYYQRYGNYRGNQRDGNYRGNQRYGNYRGNQRDQSYQRIYRQERERHQLWKKRYDYDRFEESYRERESRNYGQARTNYRYQREDQGQYRRYHKRRDYQESYGESYGQSNSRNRDDYRPKHMSNRSDYNRISYESDKAHKKSPSPPIEY